jgi:hypothetical protein
MTPNEPKSLRVALPVRRAAPYLLFAGVLIFGWRNWNLSHTLPTYNDALEVVWALKWYAGAIRGQHDIVLYPLTFYPQGWHVTTYGVGPGAVMPLLPLEWLGGLAFAYNVGTLLTFLVAFVGMRRLARTLLSDLAATLAALLYTFLGLRWYAIIGHMNTLLASALLPWMIWMLERGLTPLPQPGLLSEKPPIRQASSRDDPGVMPRSKGDGVGWFVVVGLLWALTIANSGYFLWIGGVLIGTWLIGCLLARKTTLRRTLVAMCVVAAVAFGLSAPWLIWFQKERAVAGATLFDIRQMSTWDASLNSLPIPSVFHPWLRSFARWAYRGPLDESARANIGLIASLLAIVGAAHALKERKWRPVLLVAIVGLALALGLTLKWNGEQISVAAARPLNTLIWRVGHALKPAFFASELPSPPFDTALPAPGLLLSAVLPFWEGARVSARYVLVGGIGVSLLAGLGIMTMRKVWLQLLLAGLLIVELLPPPTRQVPFPPPSHPAFDWLKQQQIAPDGIIDLAAWPRNTLYLLIGGNPLWATEYHGQPTVAGASSVWPSHIVFLGQWLQSHPGAFIDPELVPLLRQFQVRLVLFHMLGPYASEMLKEAQQNPEMLNVQCFEPSSRTGPWDYPICVMEVAAGNPDFNVIFREGWSGAEDWGRWAEDTQALAVWAATSTSPHRIELQAFPLCIPGQSQELTVEVNGAELARHAWTNCDPWATQIAVPSSLVNVGWNDLRLRSKYALRPDEATGTQNAESRRLSIGVSRLRVDPEAIERVDGGPQ